MQHSLGPMQELHLAVVLNNQDPDSQGRIEVKIQSTGMQLWANCMANSAGSGYGISFLPKQDELVVLAFLSPELPIILGSVWSGNNSHPSEAQEVEDNYAIISPRGTKITLDDSNGPQVKVETASGNHITITDEGAGEITIAKGSETVTFSSSGISLSSSSKVKIDAPTVEVNASMVTVNAGMSNFSGVVKCDTLIATSVVASSYTPGAGNVW